MNYPTERRVAKRTSVNWPVSIWHPKAGRFFNGRSMDVSQSGALVTMSMKTPVQKGQNLEINFPQPDAAKAQEKGSYARIQNARVVRIDRDDSLNSSSVKVGLQFCQEPAEELV